MSDWRPYEPSLEAERAAAYERSAVRVLRLPTGRTVRTREQTRELFGVGSFLSEGIPLPFQIAGPR